MKSRSEAHLSTVLEPCAEAQGDGGPGSGTAERDEFLANMGHELRNPLTSILAIADALRDEVYGPLNETQKSSLLSIKECVEKQIDQITNMVDLSRLDAGPLQLIPAACPLEGLVERALAMVRELARTRSIQLSSEINPNAGVVVIADARRLRQMITHLMIAGILSAPVEGQVCLRISGECGGVLIQVASSLPGVTTVLLDKGSASSALKRVRALRPIGAALLQRIVDLHGGLFAAQDIAGGGVCLSVSLPLSMVAPAAGPLVDEKGEEAAVAAEAPLILLADDQAALVDIVSDHLRYKGFRVCTAANGSEALELAEALQPDLVIMDVQMPGMDGIEAVERMRQSANPAVARVPIISLSGLGGPGDREACLAAGAGSYLAKPFGISQLEAAIRGMVRQP